MPNDFANYNNTNIESNLLATQSSAGLMSTEDKNKLDNVYDTIDVEFTLPPLVIIPGEVTWVNTFIDSNTLPLSGTYVVQIYYHSPEYANAWYIGFSGIMYWHAGTTNSNDECSIQLHSTGHAVNGNSLLLKTYTDTDIKKYTLYIGFTGNAPSGEQLLFRFKLIIPSPNNN